MCETKHPSENALIDHYNSKHSDLVELGLKLRKSKALRKQEKEEKAANQANRIVIMDEPEVKKENQSDSSSDSDESTDGGATGKKKDQIAESRLKPKE